MIWYPPQKGRKPDRDPASHTASGPGKEKEPAKMFVSVMYYLYFTIAWHDFLKYNIVS